MSLGMAVSFLVDALIDEQTIVPGYYQVYEPDSKQQTMDYMVLDAQALQHLEIVESNAGKLQGSLLHYVDHCQTMFGKRQLKRWLMSPLLNQQKIELRLNAIDEMMSF